MVSRLAGDLRRPVLEPDAIPVQPRVRVIADPLTQLQMVESSEVQFKGVRNSHSLVYELKP